jgi:tRNA A-37 threonylcarbamoyl transferase component Bud32
VIAISRSQAQTRARQALKARDEDPGLIPVTTQQLDKTQLFRAGGLVVKVWPDAEAARAAKQADRQAQVAAQMQGQCAVPVPKFFDVERGVLAMPAVAGQDLKALWQQGDTEAPRHAGRWLAEFHALTAHETQFWPRGQLNWLTGLVKAGQSGTREIIEFDAFCQAVEQVSAMRGKVRGKACRKAITHRDMTLSNLIWDGQVIWGIDFENDKEDEPLRDLFTLALDLAALGDGDIAQALADLRAAYGDTVTAPEVRLFLQRCFWLCVGANTPNAPAQRQLQRCEWAERGVHTETPVI